MDKQTLGRRNAAPVQSTKARPVPPALFREAQWREVLPHPPTCRKQRTSGNATTWSMRIDHVMDVATCANPIPVRDHAAGLLL